MPTYSWTERFRRDFESLTRAQQALFPIAVGKLVEDLKVDRYRKGLRVKAVQGTAGVFEMTWAPDGRATFEFGDSRRAGEPHVIWRRIGGHEIFENP